MNKSLQPILFLICTIISSISILFFIRKEFNLNEHVEFFISGVLCVLSIFLNGYYRCKYNNGSDFLMTKLNIGNLDGWSLSHIFYNMFLGYMFPNLFIEATAMGIAWELWENWYGENRPSWLGGFADCNLGTDQLDTDHKNWWFCRYSDIAMNLTGFMIGQYIKTNTIYIKK